MRPRVIRIETETDIERLRQVALLQRAELDRLYQRLAALTEELARARGGDAIDALQLELTAIREQLEARTRRHRARPWRRVRCLTSQHHRARPRRALQGRDPSSAMVRSYRGSVRPSRRVRFRTSPHSRAGAHRPL